MWLWLIKRTLNGHRCYRNSKFFCVQSDSCLLSTDWFSKSVVAVVVLVVAVVVVVVVVASFTLSLSLSHAPTHAHALSLYENYSLQNSSHLFFGANLQKVPVIFFSAPTFWKRHCWNHKNESVSEWVCEFFRSPWYSLSFSLALFLSFSLCSLSLSLSLSFSLSLSLSCSLDWSLSVTTILPHCFVSFMPVFFGHTDLCKERGDEITDF